MNDIQTIIYEHLKSDTGLPKWVRCVVDIEVAYDDKAILIYPKRGLWVMRSSFGYSWWARFVHIYWWLRIQNKLDPMKVAAYGRREATMLDLLFQSPGNVIPCGLAIGSMHFWDPNDQLYYGSSHFKLISGDNFGTVVQLSDPGALEKLSQAISMSVAKYFIAKIATTIIPIGW